MVIVINTSNDTDKAGADSDDDVVPGFLDH